MPIISAKISQNVFTKKNHTPLFLKKKEKNFRPKKKLRTSFRVPKYHSIFSHLSYFQKNDFNWTGVLVQVDLKVSHDIERAALCDVRVFLQSKDAS